ncbi:MULTISPECIES: phosphate transporter [Burkholderia]|uniref:Phosphate transporter n=1 Tax=Burkholderia sola TaxID=2843302 RepID=A0ABV2C4D4_9BURK|nr:phosphate transporter [Burkholderia sp. CpTa8-5]MBP0606048.1 phosphate transporter [Burkholderia sp. CpTa8-5]
MPNLAATETGGAVGHRMRTASFALFSSIIAGGIVDAGTHLGVDPRFVKEGSALPFALHGLS